MPEKYIAGVISICSGQFVALILFWNDWKIYSWCNTRIPFAQASLLDSFYHGMTGRSIAGVIPIFHLLRPVCWTHSIME